MRVLKSKPIAVNETARPVSPRLPRAVVALLAAALLAFPVTPAATQAAGPVVTRIAAGGDHTCAITTGGGVKCWGANAFGQLGIGLRTTIQRTPVDVAGLTSGVTAIAAGLRHTCAVLAAGTVRCWGENSSVADDPFAISGSGGQLGDGTRIDRLAPVTVIAQAGSTAPLSGVTAIAAGWFNTCALLVDSTVKCWGDATFRSSLGDGTRESSLAPVTVVAAPGSTKPLSGVSAITAGDFKTCALLGDGLVKCWGDNYVSQLTDDGSVEDAAPVTVAAAPGSGSALSGVTAIAVEGGFTQDLGGFVACALTASRTVKCWGNNDSGGLGDGTTTSSFTPVDVVGIAKEVTAITAGCALLVDTTVTCWPSRSAQGELLNTPFTVKAAAGSTSPLSGVTAITAGSHHTCAIMSGGGVKCWGDNYFGQLGNGSTSGSLTPVDVLFSAGQTTAVLHKPDGRIKLGVHGYPGKATPYRLPFVGNNVYNTTGASQQATVENFNELEGSYYTFDISIQNDGTKADSFKVKATGTSTTAWTVRYYRGTTNITAAVVAGTYRTPSIAPTKAYVITARITIGTGGPITRRVTIRSVADATKIDAVRFAYKEIACGC